MERRPFLVLIYGGQENKVTDYVTKHRKVLSRGYSVNLFDTSPSVTSLNKLELAMEVQQNPASNGLEWISLTSEKEIMEKLETLVKSLKIKRNDNKDGFSYET